MRLAALLLALLPLAAHARDAASDPPSNAVFEHPATVAQLGVLLGDTVRGLAQAAAVRGEFSQSKHLHELPRPLVSSGDFLVARGLGVVWHTRVPFDSQLILSAQAVVQRDGGGQATRIDASRQPGIGLVAQIFDALFSLDLPGLDQHFSLFGAGSAAQWTLGLKPREAAFGKVIDAVLVYGAAQPQRIVLFEGNGDRTEISLSGQRLQPQLSEDERRMFQ